MTDKWIAHVDASSENPGLSVAAAILYNNENKIDEDIITIQCATNNEAEYAAVLLGIELFTRHNNDKNNNLTIMSDSELVVKQINNEYRVRSKKLKLAKKKIDGLINENCLNIQFIHIRREKNKEADNLARTSFITLKERKGEKI